MIESSASGSSDSPRDPVFSAQEVTRFAGLFSQFITAMQSHADANGTHELVDLLDAHLGAPAKQMESVGASYPRWRWADVDLALDTLLPGEPVGVTGSHSEGLGDIIEDTFGNYRPGAVQRNAFPSGHGSVRYVAMNALRLTRFEGEPVVAYAHGEDMMGDESNMQIEVLTADHALSRRVPAPL